MANIKKSFNFRNGIQVDEDNLLVTSTGLVAIGKTVPTEALDVIGNVVVSGVTSSVFTQTGLLTVTTLKPTEIIGAGVSIQSGIITNPSLDSTGIVTYYGDGQYLKNLPTSEWQTTNAGFNALSIYNTKQGTVGIATTNPQSTLQIGNNPFASQIGVGIASAGNIRASGTITANVFNGSLTGNVTGNVIGNLTGNISSNVIVAGVSTFNNNIFTGIGATVGIGSTVFFATNAQVRFGGTASSPDLRIYSDGTYSRIISREPVIFTTIGTANFSSSSNALQSDNNRLITQGGVKILETDTTTAYLKYSGNTKLQTTAQGIDITGNAGIGSLAVSGVSTFTGNIDANGIIEGIAGENKIPSLYANMGALPAAGSYHGMFAHVHSTGRGYFAHAGNWLELVNKDTSGTVGTGTETYSIGSLSIGTNSPANDVHLRKTGDTELQITSDTGTAAISVGRESGTSNTNNAEIRYGEDTGANYSSAQSLDILNYGTGNFNYHLSANNPSAVAGDFHWHKGINSQRLMTLTGIGGSLGLGTTLPATELDVIGNGSFSGDLTVGNNLTIVGQLSVPTVNSTFTGNLTGNVDGNVNATGFSTFSHLKVTGITTVSRLLGDYIDVTDGATYYSGGILGKILGIGTAQPAAVVDFSQAGQQLSGTYGTARVFMLPPKVDNTQKGNLTPVSGAFIFNTSVNKLEFYDGSSWTPLEANSGGGEVNQFAFSNIAVSGQNTIVADAKQDTVSFVAGSNMTITTNATGDEVTFASSGGGGGGDITGVTAGTGLSGGGLTGDVTLNIANTSVTAGSYTNADITVDAQGRITAASNGSGGGNSISDGDKGDITVASSGTSWTIDDFAITDAKISTSAAISGSKITPTFTSNISIIKDQPTIRFFDTSDNPDYYIGNIDGVLKIRDTTNSTDRFVINSDGHVDVTGNLDVGAGLDVTGDITVTGTVDGVDIATRDTLFGGLTASSGVLTNGVTATTQSSTDSTTKVATTAFTQSAINFHHLTNKNNIISSWAVTANLSSAYRFSGPGNLSTQDNPTIHLVRGQKYEFDLNASGHPFHIQTVSGAYSSSNLYTTGVTNAGAAVGSIIFDVPMDAPNILYYVCQNHSSMAGTIDISSPDDNIQEGNSSAEVVDTGSDGHFKVTTEGTEKLRIASSGQIGLSGENYGNAGEVITSQGTSSAPTWASPHRQITDLQGTTSQINDDAYTTLNITGYKAYSLFKIKSSHEAWVRVYVDAASRTADTTRSEGQDPLPGAGLIAEMRTSGNDQTVLVTPGAFGFINDNTNNIYLSVVNRSGNPQAITVTLTLIQIGE